PVRAQHTSMDWFHARSAPQLEVDRHRLAIPNRQLLRLLCRLEEPRRWQARQVEVLLPIRHPEQVGAIRRSLHTLDPRAGLRMCGPVNTNEEPGNRRSRILCDDLAADNGSLDQPEVQTLHAFSWMHGDA